MKFTIQTILSMGVDGASSHLLIFNNSIRVLLDCGIGPTFDLAKYHERAQELKTVCLVLVSHSSLQYSGALCFLIDELGLKPSIFYATQPIMRCSPLNLHEGLLALRCPHYNKKVFNKIYRVYQSINIIKPQQRKSVEVGESADKASEKAVEKAGMEEQAEATIGEVQKVIYFTCFSAGSSMGNLTWRLNFGIVNILYLVSYNNYSLHHIGGLNLAQIMQPTDVLITDACPDIKDESMKKGQLYELVKDSIVKFYQKNGLQVSRPPPITNQENESKLLFSCEPGEMLVEVMAVMKKVLEELQPAESREKIRVVHLSSRFLQLIKSQIDYFSPYFKETLENIEQFYSHSKTLSARLSITTFPTLHTLLNDQLAKSVHIIHIGSLPDPRLFPTIQEKGLNNISTFNIFLPDERLMHSASKIEEQRQMEDEAKQDQKPRSDKDDRSEIQDQTEFRELSKSEPPEEAEDQSQPLQPLHGKYFSQIGFPHFVRKTREEDHDYDEYGMRHQYQRFDERQTMEEYRQEGQGGGESQLAQKKNATIEVMNIQFRVPETDKYTVIDIARLGRLKFDSRHTNFNSSLQIMLTMRPKNVILINTKSSVRSPDELVGKYRTQLAQQDKDIRLYELAPKNVCHLEIYNELISYKVNYIPLPPDCKLQKVKGIINYSENGILSIHLECLEQKELLEFRLDQLYKRLRSDDQSVRFSRRGIVVDGVRIYREDKNIILEGHYSGKYFKVRRMLYDFLQIE